MLLSVSTSPSFPNSVSLSSDSKIQIFKDLAQQTSVVYKRPHPPGGFQSSFRTAEGSLFRKQIDGHFKD